MYQKSSPFIYFSAYDICLSRHKLKQRREEKMLFWVRTLTFTAGEDRNTAVVCINPKKKKKKP